jgi:hypothetical protein
MVVAPLEGWRRVTVTERWTKIDWALGIKERVEVDFPEAEKIILAMDNLNTHKIGFLYEACSPEQAKGLRERLEIHYRRCMGASLMW